MVLHATHHLQQFTYDEKVAMAGAVGRAMQQFVTMAGPSWTKIALHIAKETLTPCHYSLPVWAHVHCKVQALLIAYLRAKLPDTVRSAIFTCFCTMQQLLKTAYLV